MSGFHVGYSRTPIGYKVYVPELNEIITTVHVTFNEVLPDYTTEYYQELSKLKIQEELKPMPLENFVHLIGEVHYDDETLIKYINPV